MAALAYFVTTLRARFENEEREKGATAVEYGLIVALIAAIIVVAVAALGTQINEAFEFVTTEIGTIGG